MPLALPIATPSAIALAAIARSTQPPLSTRESTSRPSSSPPSRALLDGREKGATMLAVSEWGARNGPSTAIATTKPTTARPNLPLGSDAARRRTTAQARRRGDGGLRRAGSGGREQCHGLAGLPAARGGQQGHDVGHDVDEHVEAAQGPGRSSGSSGRPGCPTALTRLEPMPGKAKTNSTTTIPPARYKKLSPITWTTGTIAFGQGVDGKDAPGGQPLQPGHLGVVRRQRLDGGGPGHPEDVRHDDDDERRHRQDQLAWFSPSLGTRRHHRHRREHVPHDGGEHDDHRYRHYELGQRGDRQRQHRGGVVEQRVLSQRHHRPHVTPTTLPITPESPTSTAELAAAGPTMLHTGIPLTRLVPGWPPRIPEIHEPYWTKTDRLRWSWCSRACTADGVAEWPRMAMAALPGRTWVAAKITTETTHNVTAPSATRWTRSLTIGCGARAPLLATAHDKNA